MMSPVFADEPATPGAAPQAATAPAPEPKPDPRELQQATNQMLSMRPAILLLSPSRRTRQTPDYAKKKKEYEEYKAQAAKEPLAVKLADTVGHDRIAGNFNWTLLTGYLVLFMQAGFALLTCGLVRRKNAAHLMMLNFAAYVFAFLAYYVCGYAFQYGAAAVNAAPTNLGGTPTLTHFLIGSGHVGVPWRQWLFLERSRLRRWEHLPYPLRSRIHGDGRLYHRRRHLRADHFLGVRPLRDFHGRHPLSHVRLLGLGRWLALAVGQPPWGWLTATWISRAQPWSTP